MTLIHLERIEKISCYLLKRFILPTPESPTKLKAEGSTVAGSGTGEFLRHSNVQERIGRSTREKPDGA